MSSSPTLAIQLLGGFALAVGGRDVPTRAWGSRRAVQIVKLLALVPGHALTIDQLLDTLWPEDDPTAARRACYQAIYLARNALDPERLGLLTVEQEGVSLQAPGGLQVDLADFTATAVQAQRTRHLADYTAALDRYRGPLLPDDRYADWAALARDEAEQLYLRLLAECAREATAQGRRDQASQLWQRLLSADPANEAAHVALMRLAAQAGKRTQALAQFRQLRTVLRRELDASPAPESERLYAAVLAGQSLPDDDTPPAARSVPPAVAQPNPTLPTPLTPLFGRDEESAAVRETLWVARLVTLTGSGGVGKTRLALAVAQSLIAMTPVGVWWVDLAALADGELVVGAVARALGVREQPDTPLLATLVAALRQRELLLVLDNCEHLVEACAALAEGLLTGCPAVRVLATSRVALRVVGEVVWRVPSLPLPDEVPPEATPEQIAALAANPALQVFLGRARLSRPDFRVTPAEASTLARICRTLDGVPLALELAAARVAVLSVGHLAERLGQALRLLTDGPRTAPSRQRTLRATLDWSYQLLDGPAQRLLAELAVFAGGWTLAAAEAVGSAGEATLAVLAGLVEQSLVQVELPSGASGEVRYRLLETVRQFAAEQLAALERTDALREAHARYFLALAREAEPQLTGSQRAIRQARLAQELGNLRAALTWYATKGNATDGLTLAASLRDLWTVADNYREGHYWLTEAFSASAANAPPLVLGRARSVAARHEVLSGHIILAQTLALECLALLGSTDAFVALAQAHNVLFIVERTEGDRDQARAHLQEAIRFYALAGDSFGEMLALNNLGALAWDAYDLPAALESMSASVRVARQHHLDHVILVPLINSGHIAIALGQIELGVTHLREATVLAQRQADWYILSMALLMVGWFQERLGRSEAAAHFLGAEAALRAKLNLALRPDTSERFRVPTEAAVRGALGTAYDAAVAHGAAWPLDEAIARALALLDAAMP